VGFPFGSKGHKDVGIPKYVGDPDRGGSCKGLRHCDRGGGQNGVVGPDRNGSWMLWEL